MSDLDLPDVNVLVALLHPSHACHRAAQAWFTGLERLATTPVTEIGFLRIALNPTVTGGATTPANAMTALRSVRQDPRAEFLADDSSLALASQDLLAGLAGYRQVTDRHLVNLAASHGARLVTFDRRIRPTLVPDDQSRVVELG